VTRLRARPLPVQGWTTGLVQDAEPGTTAPGTLVEGQNLVPTPAGRLRTRGGSRVVQTLHDASAVELSHVLALRPFTAVGALAIGWSGGEDKHYAYRLTQAMNFATGAEATSRHVLPAAWETAAPARPVMAEVYEKMFLCDATEAYSDRATLLSITNAGTVTEPTFAFGSGSAQAIRPYCMEEYNGVLFVAGYGTEDASDADRPEYLRHSFLGRSPDAADGFDPHAWLLLGSKGQRITALRKGRGSLLAAKANEFYRISGFGRAYPGWQYTTDTLGNSQGLGISNPNALTFAEGYWWGLGDGGPLRTDGFVVESLVGPRLRDWKGIDRPIHGWTAYHPERRLVLFGLHPTEAVSGRSATYPHRIWAWDVDRSVWQPDLVFNADFVVAAAIEPVTAGAVAAAPAPTNPPSLPFTSAATVSGYTANWTVGDAAVETEIWEKEGTGGTWNLVTVVAAGVTSYARTGRSNHQEYVWRARHKKSSIFSSYCDETSAKTLIAQPDIVASDLSGIGMPGLVQLAITQNASGTTIVVEESLAGAGSWTVVLTLAAEPSGTSGHPLQRACGDSYDYRAKATDAGWSVTDSDWRFADTVGPLCT
jgi:hypothetical protein